MINESLRSGQAWHVLPALLLGLVWTSMPQPVIAWETLEPGVELRWLTAKNKSPIGDSKIAVLRIDPAQWQLDLVGRSVTGEPKGHTAREWAQSHDLAIAINAGMFAQDHTTHIGYLELRGQVVRRHVNDYQSVAAFDPHQPDKPAFRIFDLDAPGVTVDSIRKDYGSLLQNLRLIKKPGENRWSPQEKRWSEAALGEDDKGRILLVFSRSPFSMRDLNRDLLGAGIGLVALQHLEGGPEAQLYWKLGGQEVEFVGSYETFFLEADTNLGAWPIPNALGLRRKAAKAKDPETKDPETKDPGDPADPGADRSAAGADR